jgi:hypothetical protein
MSQCPLLPPQNSSSLTYYRIWTSTLIARQITGWATARPKNQHVLGHMALKIPRPSLRPVSKCNIGTWMSFLGAFANLRGKNINFVMSVRPTFLPSVRMSAWEKKIRFHWTVFYEIWYFGIFRRTVKKIQVYLKSDKNNRYFAWRPI